MTIEIPPEEVALPAKVKALPARDIPPLPLAVKSPLNVVSEVPASCVIEAATRLSVDTAPALPMVRAPRLVEAPTSAEKVMLPEPALQVRAAGPSTVFMNWIGLLLEEESTLAPFATATGPLKEIEPPDRSVPPSETAPVVFWVKLPVRLRLALAPREKVPD